MRLFCCWKQNRLARKIYASESAFSLSAMTRHLVRCTDCRRAYEDMVRLQEELAQGFSVPVASEQFAQCVFEKIKARRVVPKRRVSLGNALVFVGSAPMILSVVALRQSRQNSAIAPSLLAENTPTRHTILPLPKNARLTVPHVAVERSPISTQAKPKSKTVVRVVRKRRKLHFASHATSKPPRRYRSLAWQPQIEPRAAILSPEMRSQRWTQWASFYENHGDYSHAADAYAHAYEAVPTESTAYYAGQAAENAGDVSRAVL